MPEHKPDPKIPPELAKLVKPASEQFLVRERILIFGPPKNGKSLCAASFSDKFVGFDRPKGSPIISLDDMIWIGFDPNPLVGIVEQGYDVPYLIDLSDEVGEKMLPAIDKMLLKIEAFVANVKPKAVVVDTVSFFDKNLKEFWARKYSGWDLWRMVGNSHHRLVTALKALDCHVIVIAHAKADVKPEDVQGQANKKATDLPGSGGISSQISGETKGTYEGMVSMILPMQARDRVGDPRKGEPSMVRERFFYPTGAQGFEGASRYQRYLAKEEPADLKAIFAKIKAGKEAEWGAQAAHS